jgi:polyisoprenoid-binding protein YceI
VSDLRERSALLSFTRKEQEMSVVENAKEQLLSSGSWSVEPADSTVEFRVKNMMIHTVRGRFRDFEGAIVSGNEPSVSGRITVASLETLHEERGAHLRSPDFFDVERHPEITFRGKRMRFNGDGMHFALPGELTIKGVTRPIRLDGELRGIISADGRSPRVALALHGQLDRSDYGLVWNRVLETGGVLVGDSVDLVLDIAAIRD